MKKSMKAILSLLVMLTLSACISSDYDELLFQEDGMKRKLTIELVMFRSSAENTLLYEKIKRFNEKRSDVEIEIRVQFKSQEFGYPSWFLDKRGTGDPPDLIELTTNQMKLAYHHGKLESLHLEQSQLGDVLITSPEGYVIGVKTKVNPLIVYYNKDDFLQLGLEPPSGEWDWAMLDNTITALKAAGKNVYIMLSPTILEWVTTNRYGGRIVDTSGTVFTGYLNGEQAIQAAEWIKWVGSREDDYRIRKIHNHDVYDPMPLDLIEGNMALAIDFAHILRPGSALSTFEAYIQRNDQISIAPIPGGTDIVNVAHTSGFVLPSYSENKDLAMELLRYLTSDVEEYYEDILWYTLQADSSMELRDPARFSILLQETKRSIPSSIYMYNGQNHGNNRGHYSWVRRRIMNGQPIQTELEQLAQEVDAHIDMFKEDLEHYSQCIKHGNRICS